MLDALFCRAFCLSPLLGLFLNGAIFGDDTLQPIPAESPEASSIEPLVGAQSQIAATEQTPLVSEELPTLPSPEVSPDVAENQQLKDDALTENDNGPAAVKEDTFFVYSYLNYVTMSCVSALDDPDQFPARLFRFASSQQPENAPDASAENSSDAADENANTTEESSTPVASGRRPLTAIRLADSIVQLDDSGQPLAKPEDSIPQQTSSVPVEHHYVPAPWHRSHASRNTYPIRYQPLYFEDPNMERCGETGGCLTEVKSIAHFAGRIPLLPYMMASDSPRKCVRALPDCPTCQQFGPDAYLPKPTVKAIAVQAAATVGAIYVIP
ncbi:MAG: hypothetical protein U0936_15125 [Planctomycetaceae bacterium]